MEASVVVSSPQLGSRKGVGAVELRSWSFLSELLCDLRQPCVSLGHLSLQPGKGLEGALWFL